MSYVRLITDIQQHKTAADSITVHHLSQLRN